MKMQFFSCSRLQIQRRALCSMLQPRKTRPVFCRIGRLCSESMTKYPGRVSGSGSKRNVGARVTCSRRSDHLLIFSEFMSKSHFQHKPQGDKGFRVTRIRNRTVSRLPDKIVGLENKSGDLTITLNFVPASGKPETCSQIRGQSGRRFHGAFHESAVVRSKLIISSRCLYNRRVRETSAVDLHRVAPSVPGEGTSYDSPPVFRVPNTRARLLAASSSQTDIGDPSFSHGVTGQLAGTARSYSFTTDSESGGQSGC
jgi:hypothetical protein